MSEEKLEQFRQYLTGLIENHNSAQKDACVEAADMALAERDTDYNPGNWQAIKAKIDRAEFHSEQEKGIKAILQNLDLLNQG